MYSLKFRLLINLSCIEKGPWHSIFAKFLCPNIVLERLVRRIIGDHFILEVHILKLRLQEPQIEALTITSIAKSFPR